MPQLPCALTLTLLYRTVHPPPPSPHTLTLTRVRFGVGISPNGVMVGSLVVVVKANPVAPVGGEVGCVVDQYTILGRAKEAIVLVSLHLHEAPPHHRSVRVYVQAVTHVVGDRAVCHTPSRLRYLTLPLVPPAVRL